MTGLIVDDEQFAPNEPPFTNLSRKKTNSKLCKLCINIITSKMIPSSYLRIKNELLILIFPLVVSGQTPLMLASSKLMCGILRAHLSDAQSAAADIKPIRFQGPWQIFGE